MKVLVIGSGAREHAIAHALMRGDSVSEVTVAPGNPGMELDGIRTTQLNPSNHAALIDFVKNNGYDWVFVGPEVPLIEGIVDDFAAAGIKAFGPNKAAAQIEVPRTSPSSLWNVTTFRPRSTRRSTIWSVPPLMCASMARRSSSRPMAWPQARA